MEAIRCSEQCSDFLSPRNVLHSRINPRYYIIGEFQSLRTHFPNVTYFLFSLVLGTALPISQIHRWIIAFDRIWHKCCFRKKEKKKKEYLTRVFFYRRSSAMLTGWKLALNSGRRHFVKYLENYRRYGFYLNWWNLLLVFYLLLVSLVFYVLLILILFNWCFPRGQFPPWDVTNNLSRAAIWPEIKINRKSERAVRRHHH